MFRVGHRTRESARPAVVRSAGMIADELCTAGQRPPHGAGALPADAALGRVRADAQSDAGQAITAIYGAEYRSLVRLAAALVGDVGVAEKVVQDSFVAMYGAWSRLRSRDKAVAYLRRRVISRSRSALRQGMVADGNAPALKPGNVPSAGQGAITQPECSAVISAMRALSPRQREALMLRFYLDLSEAQAASAMSISPSAANYHTARAKAAMLSVL
jgi:DNA-directed RNA polymerase specialized sigma24 family protein